MNTGNMVKKQKNSSERKGDLREIFQFFIWNAQFQKQRKESLISYLTSNEDNK